MPICIYCKEEQPLGSFNCEHVLPKAFGHFRQALTLARPRQFRVCKLCNGGLGRSLDLGLGRDSLETVLRIQRGLIADEILSKLSYDRLTMRLPPDHPKAPMLLRFVRTPKGGAGSVPMAQLRIAIDGGPLTCVPEGRISKDLPDLLAKGKVTAIHIFWWAGDPSAPDRLRAAAEAAGIDPATSWNRFPDEASLEPELIDAHLQAVIDSVIGRALAKIAFEYFFWVVERKAVELIKPELLAPLRRLILEGEGDWRRFVTVSNEPILANETAQHRTTRGHVLALRWTHTDRSAPVIAYIGLFNDVVYRVRVCDAPSLIWQSIDQGHHFNLERREVTELATGRFVRPPPSSYL